MDKYEGMDEPTDYRFEIHCGYFDTDSDRDYGEYIHSCGSYVFCYGTNDEEQARRIYDAIYNHNTFRLHDSLSGMYLHEKALWFNGKRHPEIDNHAIDLDWFFEDNDCGIGDFFPVAIYEQSYFKED